MYIPNGLPFKKKKNIKLYIVDECEVVGWRLMSGGPIMKKHFKKPPCGGSRCCIVAWSAFAVSMMTTALGFCLCFPSARVLTLSHCHFWGSYTKYGTDSR